MDALAVNFRGMQHPFSESPLARATRKLTHRRLENSVALDIVRIDTAQTTCVTSIYTLCFQRHKTYTHYTEYSVVNLLHNF